VSYERVLVWDTRPGDVVRRKGHPLRIGIVQGVEEDQILVRWAPASEPIAHRFDTLEKRT
jgi:hypothetical protein